MRPITITAIVLPDIRFPTSPFLDGSAALNPNRDYSAAYVILKTDNPEGFEGHSLTFTLGLGYSIEMRPEALYL